MPRLTQHACFACRKVFKKPTRYGRVPSKGSPSPQPPQFTCPQCKAPLVNMGHEFRAPPMSDEAEWSRIDECLAKGVSYAIPTRRKPSRKKVVTRALKRVLGFDATGKPRRKRSD